MPYDYGLPRFQMPRQLGPLRIASDYQDSLRFDPNAFLSQAAATIVLAAFILGVVHGGAKTTRRRR